jgi:rod shape-determining protein MreC
MSLTRPLTWFVSIILLGLLMIAVSQSSGSTALRGATQTAVSPVQDSLHAVFSPVADFISNIGSYNDLRQQNQDLQTENQRLSAQVAQLQEQVIQNAQLRDLAGVAQQQPDQHFETVNVVARDSSNIHDQLEIDRGSGQGIRTGMLVLGAGGALVGTVTQTLSGRAWVALLTDSASNIDAVIQESRALALVQGSVDRRLTMQFVGEGVDVKIGDTVLTSDLGGHYPAGILIGHVSAVQSSPDALFKSVSVEPAVRLDSLEHVLVLTSFAPATAGR